MGTTWRYVNKSGGPDRRFSNNVQIPIAEYGDLTIESESGMCVALQVSSVEAARQAAAHLDEMAKRSAAPMGPTIGTPVSLPPAPDDPPSKPAPSIDGRSIFDLEPTVKRLKAEGKLDEAADLLRKIIEASDADSRANGWPPAPGWYEQLAIVYRKQKRYADEVAVLEQWVRVRGKPSDVDDELSARLAKAKALLAKAS